MTFRMLIFVCLIISTSVFAKRERIVGGTDVEINSFPYQATLKPLRTEQILCNGAILSPIYVLSTANCVDDRHNSHANIRVVVGQSNSSSSSGESYFPNRIFIHPGYTGVIEEYSTIQNDIAILRLAGHIQFNEYQNRVRLPTRDVLPNDLAVLTGWGSITYPMLSFPLHLQKTWLRVITSYTCRLSYPGIFPDQFCAFQRIGTGPCIGDGGSPLVSAGRVVGITSLGFQCAAGFPDVYTNVYVHLDFITYIMNRGRDDLP